MSSTALPQLNAPRPVPAAIRHEMLFFNVFRLVQALVYIGLAFAPSKIGGVSAGSLQFALVVTLPYLLFAVAALALTGRCAPYAKATVSIWLVVDIAAAVLAISAIGYARIGIAMMLAVNLGVGALILSLRFSSFFAALATLGVLGHAVLAGPGNSLGERNLLESGLFGLAYFSITTLCHVLGRQLRASEALAEQRSTDLANLSQVNELIIRRMKTGVMLVDDANRIHQINESAWMLLGNPSAEQRDLGRLAPELSRRLYHWMTSGKLDETATQLADGVPEVVPRFSRLAPNDDSLVLIFLDDTSLLSRRAEELTLSSLGRLSASIAHEIRNPLAAISYATQLLEESRDIPEADRRLLEIIYQQTRRMNGIVENVLGLARRERAQPEHVDLGEFARHFVVDYCNSHPLDRDTLDARTDGRPVPCLVDRRQLQQIVTVLVHNALVYGRMPGEPARVSLHVHRDAKDAPLLDVVDHGPGIPETVAGQLFHPFFTTSSHGTGLGLYIAREMCLANQADLSYVAIPAGGACFRIRLAGARAIDTA